MLGKATKRLRIDRWLWCARFYKTRSAAAQAVRAAHVRVNGGRTKPAHEVVPGDRLSITCRARTFEITVTSIPSRRGPVVEAAGLYEEDPESIERRRLSELRERAEGRVRAPTPGRPDKRTRRLLRGRRREPLSPR
jgi:ribosome-associated heat shock protein Hsp15